MYKIKEICIFIALGFLIDNVFVISDIPNSKSSPRQSEYAILFFSQVLAMRDQRKIMIVTQIKICFHFHLPKKKRKEKRVLPFPKM